jgi:hypothetical protein
MEEKYKLLSDVLKKLQKKGVLNGLVIVGSWCQYYSKSCLMMPLRSL